MRKSSWKRRRISKAWNRYTKCITHEGTNLSNKTTLLKKLVFIISPGIFQLMKYDTISTRLGSKTDRNRLVKPLWFVNRCM